MICKMELKIIKDEKEYNKALDRVDELMAINPELGTKQSDELEILVLLIENYEQKHWNIDMPDPMSAT